MRRFFVAAALVLFCSITMYQPAKAMSLPLPPSLTYMAACGQANRQIFGFPPWDSCLPRDGSGEIVITSLDDLWLIAIPIVESLVRAAGYISVGFVIWGAILFIKSQGDSGKIASARQTIRDALIGLVIAISAVGIIQYVASKF